MSKLYNHLKDESAEIRLSDAEKAAMRARLTAAMRAVPTHSIKSPYQWLWAPRSFAVLAIALLVVVSSGTAFAAEGSLPGAPLYPVKVNVIEPLTVALATTPAAKAQVNANIATTRVQEAQALAAEGNLTPAVAEEISTNYNEHATAALALAADADAASATSTTSTTAIIAVATTSTEVAGEPVPAPVAVDTSALASSTDQGMPVDIPADVTTFAVRMPMAAEVPSTTTPTTTVHKMMRVAPMISVATTTTPASDTLEGRLDASLSVQAKILDTLTSEIRVHHTKTPQ